MMMIHRIRKTGSRVEKPYNRRPAPRATVVSIASFLVAAAFSLLSAFNGFAAIPEPPTVLYGSVINPTSGQPYHVTEGTLSWTIATPTDNAAVITLTVDLQDLAGLSYRLDIPHEALALDETTVADGIVPLAVGEAVYRYSTITVNGLAAHIVPPAESLLGVNQASRARTHRIDLTVSFPLPDTDGDGMPDWWEDQYNLDSQVNDASADADGDGANNLYEFINALDPTADDSAPKLLTTEIVVYEACDTGVQLVTADTDSSPAEIFLTLVSLPEGGELRLDGVPLTVGDEFSQEAVDAGRLVFSHSGTRSSPTAFDVQLTDHEPDREPIVATVIVNSYRPDAGDGSEIWQTWLDGFTGTRTDILHETAGLPPDQRPRVVAWLLGRWLSNTVWDASDTATPQALEAGTRASVLIGSAADDVISGNTAADTLGGGPGSDTMRGGAGPDIFLMGTPGPDLDSILDFAPEEADILDFGNMLSGSAAALDAYVRLTDVGDDTHVGVDTNGDGSGYTDYILVLANTDLSQARFEALWAEGQIINTGLADPIHVTVTGPTAIVEEGVPGGGFSLARTGSLDGALTVSLLITGTAVNGVDMSFILPQVTFARGESRMTIPLDAYDDGITEPNEIVEIVVLPSVAYAGAGNSAKAFISDRVSRAVIGLELVAATAMQSEGSPGIALLTRSDNTATTSTVSLHLGGTAISGIAYQSIAPTVVFSPGETVKTITVSPLPGHILADGRETVTIAVVPDPANAYSVNADVAEITIFADPDARELWNLIQNGDLDPDYDGMTTAEELAIGSDPQAPTLQLDEGLNLISVPHVPGPGDTVVTQLGDALEGTVWTWDNGHYEAVPRDVPLVPGKGYIVGSSRARFVDLAPGPEGTADVSLQAGWNAIGVIRGGEVAEDLRETASIYALSPDGERSQLSMTSLLLQPLTGYWVYVPEAVFTSFP